MTNSIARSSRQAWTLYGLVVASIVLALFSTLVALQAGTHAGNVAACVNDNLGARNAPAVNDSRANIAYTQAQDLYGTALLSVLLAPKDQTQAKYAAFLKVATEKQMATQTYVTTLVADQHVRDSHPLGKC